jgi:hypothetical protein
MSNEPEDKGQAEPPAPAAPATPEPAPTYDFGLPTVIMRGGTTSSRQDAEYARHRVDAERRRREDDRQRDQRSGARQTQEGFEIARQGAMRMVTQASPKLVLHYMNRDGSIRQDCESEITQIPEGNGFCTMFAMVCPRCVERGVPQGMAQMMVRDNHRKWHLDTRHAGKVDLVDAWGEKRPVIVAGTVSCDDLIKCDNGCGYVVRIHNSEVWVA